MNKKSACQLYGALRLSDNDGIGIPIYSHPKANHLFIGETDFDLRIVRFIDYFDESQYHLDRDIVSQCKDRKFTISDFGPIPLYFKENALLIPGGVTLEEFDDEFGLLDGDVLSDVREILKKSREGYFQNLQNEASMTFFRQEYGDVLQAAPVHSKYWISRYRASVLAALSLGEVIRQVAIRELRLKAFSWVERFLSKGDLRLLSSLLEVSEGNLLSRDEVRLAYFYQLAARLQNWDYDRLKLKSIQEIVRRYFPMGLYGFWLNELPRIVRENPVAFGAGKFERSLDLNFPEMFLGRLFEFKASERSLLSSILIFGGGEIPSTTNETLNRMFSEQYQALNEEITHAFRDSFKRNREAAEWRREALRLLAGIEAVDLVDRMRSSERRVDGNPRAEPFFDSKIVDDLRRISRLKR